MKNNFIFYKSFYEAIQIVKDKSMKADIYDAICELGLYDNDVELTSEAGQIIMNLISPVIKTNNQKYKNGKKGGRPKKTGNILDEKKPNQNQTETTTEPSSRHRRKKKEDRSKKIEDRSNNILSSTKTIIDYLNKKIGTHYKATTKSTQAKIHARLSEGYKLDDFYLVIDKKAKEWLNTKMEIYLRPETLFGTKFENYVNQKETVVEKTIAEKNKEFLEKRRLQYEQETNR